ncbi:uncharacterized protein LAJ45_03551 [Morchella importuna]|uniref:uncharacterized protein n=1 Tax=Morchella importuna TaxID=1174673 RepID=UPI001E8EAE6F|nr:uncharacterized protein LAJ45_03551 [Morchella importuna]KAH8152125.1 hypothetical protein LAJ45_03551 [Morchella importuna]
MFGYDLTPGMVSSIIAAGILIIQWTLPLFIGIVLAGLIQNASTANTWSVITTLLHNSNLHTLLFSDSASTTHIARPVLFLSYLALLSLGLTALSGVLTPLGIREDVKGRDVASLRFELALDNGSFFLGTAERKFYALTRVCGVGEEACPGQEGQTVEEEEGRFEVAPWKPVSTVVEESAVWVETPTGSATSSWGAWTESTSTTATSGAVSDSASGTAVTRTGTKSSETASGTRSGTETGTGTGSETATPTKTGTDTGTTTPSKDTGTSNRPTQTGSTPPKDTGSTPPKDTGSATPPTNTGSTPTDTGSATPPVVTPPSNTRSTPSDTPPATSSSKDNTNVIPTNVDSPVQLPGSVTARSDTNTAPAQVQQPVDTPTAAGAAASAASASSAYLALHRRSDPTPEAKAPTPPPSRRRLRKRASSKKYRIGSSVPAPLTALFTKASYYGASVASVFDIQFRNYIILNLPQHQLANGLKYTIGQFRFLETLILSRGFKLIDGLVVDTKDGGVGFRKHAVPDREKKKYGASWGELLLWVAPETVCVANNVSLQVTTDDDGGAASVLVDTGGFRGLVGVGEPDVLVDVAGVPDLAGRAWRGAYYFNRDVAGAVGASGGAVAAAAENTTFEIEGESVWISRLQEVSDSLGDSQFVVHRVPLGAKIVDGVQNGTSIDTHCAGLTPTTPSGAPLVTCGLIIGAPRRTDTESSTLAGTYRYPLYTCATAIQATLRTTTFTSNGTTRDLASLTIHNTTLPTSAPLWGLESHPALTAAQISPLWGPLHPSDEHADGIIARRAHALYLPAGQGGAGIADSLAGTGAYQYAAGLMYETSALTPDYSGKTNYALYRQWERVTADAGSVAQLPGLVWTDVFANLVTSVAAGGRGVGVVTVYDRVLWYDVRYAVPVGVLVVLWGGMWGVALAFWVGRRVRVKELRQLLNQVSTGRVVVNMLEGSKEGALAASRWAKGRGRTVVGLECRGAEGVEGWEREGDEMVGGMVVGFVEAPVEGRVLELLKRERS